MAALEREAGKREKERQRGRVGGRQKERKGGGSKERLSERARERPMHTSLKLTYLLARYFVHIFLYPILTPP